MIIDPGRCVDLPRRMPREKKIPLPSEWTAPGDTIAMTIPCPVCDCHDPEGAAAHAIVAAVSHADIDRALEAGLLDTPGCAQCGAACTTMLLAAREDRSRALAARERYHARNARLERRAAERATRRAPPAVTSTAPAERARPGLPPAAAAALERAKARAAAPRKP